MPQIEKAREQTLGSGIEEASKKDEKHSQGNKKLGKEKITVLPRKP